MRLKSLKVKFFTHVPSIILIIGDVPTSGNEVGPHIHFEIPKTTP